MTVSLLSLCEDPAMMLSQEWVRFLVVGSKQPVLAIAADEPPDAAHLLAVVADALVAVEMAGWSIVPRLTFVMVSAPEDEGFTLLCADADQVDDVDRWLTACEATRGTWLAFVPVESFDRATALTIDDVAGLAGGFVPTA